MKGRPLLVAAVVAGLAPAPATWAQDQSRDDSIFGATETPPADAKAKNEKAVPPPPAPAEKSTEEQRSSEGQAPDRSTAPPATTAADARDEAVLGDAGPNLSETAAPEDPLRMGGQFYLRASSSMLEGQSPKNAAFTTPALLDVYLDGRPNDRVRGFVLGRMHYDSTRPVAADVTAPVIPMDPMSTSAAAGGTAPLGTLGTGTRGPTVFLDQLWLRFDILRTVFVTAGKQHVRWGTARFWTPTDYLHVTRRDPLAVFDARVGTSMLKLHLPWEARGWNFYAYAVTERLSGTPTAGDVAGALRAEVVFGTTEIGLGGFFQRRYEPKLAADVSTGLGDVDLYGEVAVRNRGDMDRVRYDANATEPAFPERPPWVSEADYARRLQQQVAEAYFPRFRRDDWRAQVVAGATYQRKYNDNDLFTVGVEYFYNPLGYSEPPAYLGLLLARATPLEDPAAFFYLGRQYAAAFVNVPAPYSWNYTTFTLSTIGNLSDQSFITRLDYSVLVLTHLRFEAYGAVRYGQTSGEFRLGLRDFELPRFGAIERDPALFDMGVALRVNL